MIRGEADGSISEAAAARPTAPSGAENQDNFIVIISLSLSLSIYISMCVCVLHMYNRKRGGR